MQIYDRTWAENYERNAEISIPGRAGLYRLCKASLLNLAADAHVLVVGCGTGTDLIGLAQAFPGWTFDAVEPADGMLTYCRSQITALGLDARISTHACTLDNFKPARQYDAVTAILVSQHISDAAEAGQFFAQLYAPLKPGGTLFSADLHIASGQSREAIVALWATNAKMSGAPPEMLAGASHLFASTMRPRDEADLLKLITDAGFRNPLKVFSSLLYGAWRSERAA